MGAGAGSGGRSWRGSSPWSATGDAGTEALVRSNAGVVGVFVGACGPAETRGCHEALTRLLAAGELELVPGPRVGFDPRRRPCRPSPTDASWAPVVRLRG